MTLRAPVILLALACLVPVCRGQEGSVVPADARIDDRDATLALAEAQFQLPATRTNALATLAAWLGAHPGDLGAAIRLARYETWTNRAPAAIARLEVFAASTGPTPELRDALVEAYLQAGRYDDAIRESDALLAATAEPTAALLAAAGEARLRAGHPDAALPFFAKALALAPDEPSSQRAYALLLAYAGRNDEALPRLETIARAHPDDVEVTQALVNLSRSPEGADKLIDLIRDRAEHNPDNPDLLLQWAELEAARGHAATARSLYTKAIAKAAPGQQAIFRLSFARARLGWGDFYGAEEVFRADPARRGEWLDLLVAMDRLEEAEAGAQAWLAADPAARPAADILQSVARKRHLQPATPGPVDDQDPVRSAFLKAGIAKARSAAFLDQLTAMPESAAHFRQWAAQYAGAGDFPAAIRCLRTARLADPEYFPARLDLAEYLAIDGRYEEADREFSALAAAFPESRQVLLKQARALGWSRRYQESLAAYTALRAHNPADPLPLLEQARVAGWAKERAESARLYAASWKQPVDAQLAAGLRPILESAGNADPVQRWRQWAASGPAQSDEPFAATERLEAEAETLATALPPAARTELARLRLDLRADFLLQRGFWLENEAKQLAWDRRWWRAADMYARLLAVAPDNQEALFDLAQVRAAQGLGHEERATLNRLLAIDANNRLVGQALFRRDRRSEPQLSAQFDYYREKGRDDLSSILRTGFSFGGEFLRGDRIRLSAAWRNWRDAPDYAAASRAQGFSLGAEGMLSERFSASADYTHKDADARGSNITDTGGAQAWVHFRDGYRLGAGVDVREELANAFALVRGVRSTQSWLGAVAALGRRGDIEARATNLSYSDHNAGTWLWISPGYAWTDHPRTFKTILTLEARDTDHANLYQYTGPVLTDIVHPYWTPRNYRGATLTLEWRHDLARDFFIGAQEHWYDIRVSFSDGSDGNQGIAWVADYAREWRDRWVLRIGAGQTRSQQWNDGRFLIRLARRF